jgi:ferric-dicitrate binding protein FerR (iron transport regulator)
MKEKESISQDVPKLEEELLKRYLRGLSSDTDKARIKQWMEEDPDNEKTLRLIAKIYYAQRTKARIQARDPLAAYHKVVKRRRKARHLVVWRQVATVAACVALTVSVAVNFLSPSHEQPEQQYVTIQTHAGMRTRLNLPDGTIVHLNSAGKLTYPVAFEADVRRVTLNGEGYFQVAPDAKRPFIVKAEDKPVEVKALGTIFNMQAYAAESRLKTTLVEGVVKFGISNGAGVWKEELLEPATKAVYDRTNGKVVISSANIAHDTAWIQGRLVFKDTPVPEVLTRLTHFYNVTFDVRDTVINTYMFTGTFENRQLSQVLDYLNISSRIHYKIIPSTEDDSQGVRPTTVILKKR